MIFDFGGDAQPFWLSALKNLGFSGIIVANVLKIF